ncbi:type II toxin-antitoxin system HicB family antitoxin [Streptomyces sp. 5-10]|uniref:type II toxin-antitoxin system HicB family antitoxin n=1 Tax=Streptomyces sp. 5-10 TaxID=878925 RepID=UPI00168B17E4|nr:hypothetical protein [Streptomyces sp. 5-10]MBD3004738.1 hypothetical protein [Streptomyces sp. 5-10]
MEKAPATVHKGVATRSGDWWMVTFKSLGPAFVTQGRDEEDARVMARDMISLMLEVDPGSFEMDIEFDETPESEMGVGRK